jgi:hypothetical protein
MSANSKTLVIALGGVGLLAVVAAAARKKAAPLPEDEPAAPMPNALVPMLPSQATRPGGGGSAPSVVLEAPSLDPMIEPPGPPIPLAMNLDPASYALDPMVEPPGPPIPASMNMQTVTAAPVPPPPSSPSSMPIFPVTAPAATSTTKRPFGDQPLDVHAGKPNVKPPPAGTKSTGVAPTPAAKRNPAQAALDLLAYVTPILAAKRGSELGLKNKPNAFVKAAQLDMNDLPTDGIYGPRTRAKGTALTGKKFPPRV